MLKQRINTQIILRIRRLKILEEHDGELSVKNQQKMKQVKKERKTAVGIEACTRKRENSKILE